jgi:hypothetical protein
MRKSKRFGLALLLFCLGSGSKSKAADTSTAWVLENGTSSGVESSGPGLWEQDVGQGFRSGIQTFSVEAGATHGLALFGSVQQHDLALLSISYGCMLGHTVGVDHFYRGNWELRGELFGGAQFSPTTDWILGLAPHLRYNFATGTRFIPFIDGGAGVTATSIGPPDLSNTFEFNLQATVGIHWFIQDNLSLTLEARYLHMSCAGISHPNLGLNGVMGMIGVTRFF